MESENIRIGTRNSALALHQAKAVQQQLEQTGRQARIIEITSDGDADLTTPLYEMGIQGIFTRALDIALLDNRIDIAVHAAKDIPTRPAAGLTLAAVLERGTPFDCLVLPRHAAGKDIPDAGTIGTCSLRRQLQWRYRYPNYAAENLRGNVQTRLRKLDESSWVGAVFAEVALARLDIKSHPFIRLDWMLPAPAQGAIGIVCREGDAPHLAACRAINHEATEMCITAERHFLAALHGGCAVPVAAHAKVEHGKIYFRGNVISLDARQKLEVALTVDMSQAREVGRRAADELLQSGAAAIVKTFRT
jgi:hydroxymethylbilane synthase